MYNIYINGAFGQEIKAIPLKFNVPFLRFLGAIAAGFLFIHLFKFSALSAQTLQLVGNQPDYPMVRNGIPLIVDGSAVRIAGAEFRFYISSWGEDSLVKKTPDGRMFFARGTCQPDAQGGFHCSLNDTAGNPQVYRLSSTEDTVGVWHCVGRHSEPAFFLREEN